MNKELSELHRDIPTRVSNDIEMSEANKPLQVYSGTFLLKDDFEEVEIDGEITFDWVPNSGVHFCGNTLNSSRSILSIFNAKVYLKIIVNGLEFGEGFVTHIGSNIKGVISNFATLGDKSISVDKLSFSIPNLRNFHGLNIKKVDGSNFSFWRGRIDLENEKYSIQIDKKQNYKDLDDQLKEKGGFILMYSGEIISKKGSIDYKESREILHCLNTFLTFLNGRRTAGLVIQGVYKNETKWYDYTDYYVDQYKNVPSWTHSHSTSGFSNIWINFSKIWQDRNDRDFLTSAIHWYVEANNNSGFADGSIIMAQTALELIYNWWIIENKGMITGKDAESINASNKIRLLISQLDITCNIPSEFKELENFKNGEKQIFDGPDAIVQIRNAIVHSQEEKRKKLSSISPRAKFEALQLCLWYIELSLLKVLGYDNKYYNRTSSELVRVKAEELMPWINSK